MSDLRYSIALQGNKTLAEYRELGQLAEEVGFGGVSVYADLGFQPAIVPLLEIARATRRVRVGPAALNPWLLHPVEIAGQLAMLDHASNGRAYLGLARGAWLDDLGIDTTNAVARMLEAVTVVRMLLSGNDAGFSGNHFQLPPRPLLQYPVLSPDLPLLIGAWGPQILALAGEVADEVKIGGSANPALVPEVQRRLQVGAERVDRRDPAGIVFGAVTVVDTVGTAARRLARQEVARYLPVVAALDPTVEIEPELLERMNQFVAEGDELAAAELVPDELLDRFAFSGTPVQVADQIDALFAAGVTRVEFGTPHGLDSATGIRLLGSII